MKKLLYLLARTDVLWNLVWHPLAKFARHMTWQRSHAELNRLRSELSPDYRVQAGPFAGMKYPGFESIGSGIIGKLLGTYEVELNDWMSELLNQSYEVVVDVGCAEGYYAVGFALKNPTCHVYAFDINERARELCQEMAVLNNVSDRVHVRGLCTPDELILLVKDKKALIISDCEAGEMELFTDNVIPDLSSCDVLIESHDFIVRGISEVMQHRFEKTHRFKMVHTMLPLEKAKRHPSSLIRESSPFVLEWLYNEGRPESMHWLLFKPQRHLVGISR